MKEQVKNWMIVVIVCTLIIAGLIIAIKINENRINDELSTSKIKKYLTEINYDDISTYVIENSDAIIYVSNSSEDNTIKFDEIFIPVIKKYNLENDVIYININKTTTVDLVYDNAPELIFYKDGQISDIIDGTTLKNSKAIVKILKERSVIGD